MILEGVFTHLHSRQVGEAMAWVPGVVSGHDLHIWTMGNSQSALSAHVVIGDMAQWPGILAQHLQRLDENYHVERVTLQPELIPDISPLVQVIREPQPEDSAHTITTPFESNSYRIPFGFLVVLPTRRGSQL